MPEPTCSQLASILGVSIVEKHAKYLGLPTVVGRNRTETFTFIKEQLSQKLEGWQGKLLSGAGKDILIRVVAQTLPSYTMNCFLLPKSFCNALHQMCARFWWGTKEDGKRKIHWMSWQKLCRPKEEGGMGFRDLFAHNLALLAKQGWRLIKFPNSLVSRMYKAKYFPHCDFWAAATPSGASACWKGIFEARELLRSGVRWRVGDGTSIDAWLDPWIPRPLDFLPIGRLSDSCNMVSDFITVDRKWDQCLLAQHFPPEDVSFISSIALSVRVCPDKLIWHYEKKGFFSTKSAYHLCRTTLHQVHSSSEGDAYVPFWKKLWFAKVPGKIKIHIWRACSNILPTTVSLRQKRVFVDDGCFFCNEENESIEHVGRDCCFVRDMVKSFYGDGRIFDTVVQPMSFLDWLSLCSESLDRIAFSSLLVILWKIWKERN